MQSCKECNKPFIRVFVNGANPQTGFRAVHINIDLMEVSIKRI